jgi:hypothetical protein
MSRPRRHADVAVPPGVAVTVHEFTYSTGRLDESVLAPNRGRRGRAAKGQVQLIVDSDGGGLTTTTNKLRDEVVDLFHRDSSGSITSTLMRTMQRLNERLLTENRRSVRAERCYATIACAVVRAEDVYVAVAGRALAYVAGPAGWERFGRGDPKVGEPPVNLLGQVEDIGVDMFHRPVGALHTLILASSGIRDLDDGAFESTVQAQVGPIADVIRSLGLRHRGRRRFSAAVLTFEVESDRTPSPVARVAPAEPITTLVARSAESLTRNGLFALPPRRVAAPDDQHANGVAHPVALPSRRRVRPQVVPPGPTDERSIRESARGESATELPESSNGGTEPRRTAVQLLDLILAIRPPGRVWRGALLVALLIALFYVGYVGVQVPARLIQQSSDSAAAIAKLAQAEQRERDALGQSDPLVRRPILGQAYQLAADIAAQQPGLPAAQTAVARIRSEYQGSNGVTPLPSPVRLVDLPTPGDQLILVDTALYVLDRTDSRVYSYLLNVEGTSATPSASPILVRGGDHVGSATVGSLGGMVWMPAGGARKDNSLLVLDLAGFLLQSDPTHGLSLLALGNPESWTNVTQIRGYNGILYALIQSARQLAVYPPEPSGYDGAPREYFAASTNVDLSDAVTFAVDQDVYLAHASGRIQRFTDGSPSAFAGLPDDLAPINPVGIAASDSAVFVGDPSHGRVVELSRAGVFERFLTPSDPSTVGSMRDLAISADATALLILDGQTIYRFALPS